MMILGFCLVFAVLIMVYPEVMAYIIAWGVGICLLIMVWFGYMIMSN